eukprot:4985204-Lingulodinium_polyedra.AAC.1
MAPCRCWQSAHSASVAYRKRSGAPRMRWPPWLNRTTEVPFLAVAIYFQNDDTRWPARTLLWNLIPDSLLTA